jgi:hypothetical protein
MVPVPEHVTADAGAAINPTTEEARHNTNRARTRR